MFGLIVLLLLLLARDRFAFIACGPLRNGEMENIGKGLLAQLSLLFVLAACRGLILSLLMAWRICAILVLSLIAILLATLFTLRLVSRLIVQRDP